MDPSLLSSPSYLSISGISSSVFSNLFTAAAELYRLAPWVSLREEIPIEIRFPHNELPRIAVVMGAAGDVFGLSVYDSLDDLGRMYQALNPQEIIQNLSWLTLCYESSTYLAPEDLQAIEENRWSIASEAAYPVINRMGAPGSELYPPTREDIFWLEGALPTLNETFHVYYIPGSGADLQPQQLTLTVQTAAGPKLAGLCVPARGVSIRQGV